MEILPTLLESSLRLLSLIKKRFIISRRFGKEANNYCLTQVAGMNRPRFVHFKAGRNMR